MSIPKFNNYGVLPKGVYDCTLEEAYKRFGAINAHREQRWEKFLKYFEKVKSAHVANSVIIDGSFVTDKPNPNDIDIVVSLKDKMLQNTDSGVLKELFDPVNVPIIYRIQSFPHFENHEAFKNDFSEYFQYLKPNAAKKRGMMNGSSQNRDYHKGIVRVNL